MHLPLRPTINLKDKMGEEERNVTLRIENVNVQ